MSKVDKWENVLSSLFLMFAELSVSSVATFRPPVLQPCFLYSPGATSDLNWYNQASSKRTRSLDCLSSLDSFFTWYCTKFGI